MCVRRRSRIDPISTSASSLRRAAPAAVLVVAVAFLLQPCAWAEKLEQLKPQGYVNDFAGVIDTQVKTQLTTLCTELDRKAHAQIALVTIRTLEGVPTEDFASKLYERWGIGPKSDNRGVLILLAAADHKYRVEVGYGLEPILPDGKVGGFGREMVPLLRQGDYSGALLQLTNEIARVIAADRGVTLGSLTSQQPRPDRQHGTGGSPLGILLLIAALAIFGGIGGGGAFLAWILFGRGAPRSGRWGGPWLGGPGGGTWSGGGFGGGSSGGFGGFGGGSSGGGGASGSW